MPTTSSTRSRPVTSSTESCGSAVLRAAGARLGQTTVDHPYFKEARLALQEKLDTHSLVLLVGSSGVGKDRLVRKEVERLNEPIRDDLQSLRAVHFSAPSPQRGPFPWSAFWRHWLRALEDPLPDCKVDREFKRERLSRGTSTPAKRGSVDALRNAGFAATRDRGVEVVFVNEAMNLLPNERSRSLRDQLDVLRDLTDNGCCKIVLVATPRILEPLNLSGELARRIGDVFFRRYAGGARSPEFEDFASVVRTFVDRLPDASRSAVHRRVRLLHAGSLGCVGILHDWFLRAITRGVRQKQEILDWHDFATTVLSDQRLETLKGEALAGDRLYCELSARTFGGLLGTPTPPDVSAEAVASPIGSSAPSRSPRRVGTPKPTRHKVPGVIP